MSEFVVAKVLPFSRPAPEITSVPATRRQRLPLGEALLHGRAVNAEALDAALVQQAHQDQRLGRILMANRAITSADLNSALSKQSGIGQIDLAISPPEITLLHTCDPYACLAAEAVPWRQIGGTRIIAISSPDATEAATVACGGGQTRIAFALAPSEDVRRAITGAFSGRLSHYAPAVYYEPGTYDLHSDTRYVALLYRVQLLDDEDPNDVATANALQDQFIVQANSAVPFPDPEWDVDSMLALRSEYEVEFKKFAQFEPDWMGPRGEVNEETRHLAAAGAWGLFPEKDAVYINYVGPPDPTQCYSATYDTPETEAFWSITVYGDDGFMESDNNVINDRNVTPNDDGTFTAFFGSETVCGAQANRVDISEGWNFLLRIYRPGPAVLSREYQLPEVSLRN